MLKCTCGWQGKWTKLVDGIHCPECRTLPTEYEDDEVQSPSPSPEFEAHIRHKLEMALVVWNSPETDVVHDYVSGKVSAVLRELEDIAFELIEHEKGRG